MIENISLNIAKHIKSRDNNADVESLKHVIQMILSTLSVIGIGLLVGLIIGNVGSVGLAMLFFAMLRLITGGHHIESTMLCILLSVILLIFISFIPLNNNLVVLCNFIAIALVLTYAPFNIEDKTNINKRHFILLKFIGVAIVLSNFIWMSDVIACAFMAQSLLLINLKRGGGNK